MHPHSAWYNLKTGNISFASFDIGIPTLLLIYEIASDTTFSIASGWVHKLVYSLPILKGPSGDDGVSSSSGAS